MRTCVQLVWERAGSSCGVCHAQIQTTYTCKQLNVSSCSSPFLPAWCRRAAPRASKPYLNLFAYSFFSIGCIIRHSGLASARKAPSLYVPEIGGCWGILRSWLYQLKHLQGLLARGLKAGPRKQSRISLRLELKAFSLVRGRRRAGVILKSPNPERKRSNT